MYSIVNILNEKNAYYCVICMDNSGETHTCEKYINLYSRMGKTIYVYLFLAWKFLLVFLPVICVLN